jgi:RND family efflux transporter MFP subunit
MRINNAFKVLLSFFVVSVLSACSGQGVKEEKPEETVFKVPVETTALKIGSISNTYNTTAVLEARAESRVVNKVTGMIDSILVEEGMFVNKGDVLAEIDSENYLLELERTTIDLESVEAEFARSQPVDGRQLIAIKDFEKLEFQVKTRKNQQKVAAIQVRDSKVRAPISGVIAQRMVKEGNMTPNTGAEMFMIVALDTLQGLVYLPESEINNVHVGQEAFLEFPSTAAAIPARVSLISPIIDTDSGTFKVTLSVNNDDYQLKPGMFARVSLTLDVHNNAQLVPLKSITTTDTDSSLFVVRDNKAARVMVKTGYEQDGYVEILTPLNLEEPIITIGQQSLKEDSEVRIIGQQGESDGAQTDTDQKVDSDVSRDTTAAVN